MFSQQSQDRKQSRLEHVCVHQVFTVVTFISHA
jgi:hypothetical protein